MKKLFVYLIALSVLLPTAMVAANSTPQKPPKITRPTKPMSKPNVKPRTPANRSHRQSSQSSSATSQRVNPALISVTGAKTFTVNGVNFTMVGVQGGTFHMGSKDGRDDEKPIHSITLSSYYIGQTEVTQALWKVVMGSNPSNFKGDNLPVEMVSWNDCQSFITKLNQQTGEHFRLPTEAEWEFAVRGGRKSRGFKYSGNTNIDYVAWYDGNFGSKTHPVATKSPNELGIYDMSGNVYEWCQDWKGNYCSSPQTNPTGPTSGSGRVIRGGGWRHDARYCRSAFRGHYAPDSRSDDIGLRLVLSE